MQRPEGRLHSYEILIQITKHTKLKSNLNIRLSVRVSKSLLSVRIRKCNAYKMGGLSAGGWRTWPEVN